MTEAYLIPLFLTVLIEETAAYLLGLRGKDLLLVLLVNVITNPVLVTLSLTLMYYISVGTGQILTYLILEPIVIYVEYRFFDMYLSAKRDPFRLSLILNLLSITGGILWQTISKSLSSLC